MTVGRHRGKAARGFEAPVACGAGAEGVWSGGGGRVRAGGSGEGEVRRTLSRIVCCVHWPSGLIDSSLMEASVCRSARVSVPQREGVGLVGAGAGVGLFQAAWVSVGGVSNSTDYSDWLGRRVYHHSHVAGASGVCGVCGVSGVGRGWAGEGEGLGEGGGQGEGAATGTRYVLDSSRASAGEVVGDAATWMAARVVLVWRAPVARRTPGLGLGRLGLARLRWRGREVCRDKT